jgi:hypothetical protein
MAKIASLVGVATLIGAAYGANNKGVSAPNVKLEAGNAQNGGCLSANGINVGSKFNGSGALGFNDQEVNSLTDNFNFINFCTGKQLTQGIQNPAGSCNPIGEFSSERHAAIGYH